MVSRILQVLTLVGAVGICPIALGELDPELAVTSSEATNDPGLFATAMLSFGQSRAVEKSRPGATIIAGGELGYAMPRDSWARLQGGIYLGAGILQFRSTDDDHADQRLTIGLMPILRGGYGYSLGHNTKFLWRVGAGTFLANYKTEINDVSFKSSSTFIGLVGQLGGEVLMSPSSWFELVAGIDFNHYAFDVDEVEASGNTQRIDASFNVNAPMLTLGLKIRL